MLIGCLYLPNGNPAPGPKFDYKLRWFERLTRYAAKLLKSRMPVVLAGDYNVMPTELDVYKPERWVDDALFRPEVARGLPQAREAGLDRRAAQAPSRTSASTRSGITSGTPGRERRAAHRPLPADPGRRQAPVAAGVDREVRGWEKTSDHAPVWIELKSGPAILDEGSEGHRIALRLDRRDAVLPFVARGPLRR